MDDYTHMIAVYIKQNQKERVCSWKKKHTGSRWSKRNWILNRPALCCTWSCGSCERPCRVSSQDTAVPDTQNTAVSPGVSFPFSLKGGTVAFPAVPDHLTLRLFPCCFLVLIQLPLWDHSPDIWHTLMGWGDVRNCSFMACGVCYLWRSQALFPTLSFLLSVWSAPKLLSPPLSLHLNSSSINPLHYLPPFVPA